MNSNLRHHVQTALAEAVSSCRTFGDEAWSQHYLKDGQEGTTVVWWQLMLTWGDSLG
jgi:hypothetical protein